MALVLAAGGVVSRRQQGGAVEVLLVHRPRYGDWTFPKGKLEVGESADVGALREVEEESGLRCLLGRELAVTSYEDRHGRPKQVRYWSMTPVGGEFAANHEVDEVQWLSLEETRARLTYERDGAVLDALVSDLEA